MRTDEAEAYASMAGTGKGGRNLPGTGAGAEARTAAVGRTKPEALRLMEAAVERSNMLCAYERVVKNRGAPGVDGLTVAAFKPWLQAHWPKVRQALLAGEYMPAAVRKVEIPKPQGGVRTLGIPTVLDRLIQQALHQVMQPLFEPEFCESSYGFRPGRNAHQAVQAARGYVAKGKRWAVDLDLEKFFDRVNHDVLMARVGRKVKDERVLKLIRRYLEAGLMEGGVVSARTEGTPQGESASNRSAKGNRAMRRLLNQLAHAAVRKRDCYLQILFQRLSPRLGYAKAVWAIAHRLCRLIWKVLHEGVRYVERGPAVSTLTLKRRKQRLLTQLKKLGYSVQLTPLSGITADV